MAELSVRYSEVAKHCGNVLTVHDENIRVKRCKSDNKEEELTIYRVFQFNVNKHHSALLQAPSLI